MLTYTDMWLEIRAISGIHSNRTQNCRWWQWLALCGSRGMGNGGNQVLWGQEWGEGPGAQIRSPGFVRDARVNVSDQGDKLPALALPPGSTFPALEPFSQAGICCSANKDSRLPSWHPLVHHGALLESSSLHGGVPALHHPLPHTPAAQVPFGLGPSFPILALLIASKALGKTHWPMGRRVGQSGTELKKVPH